MGTVFTVCLTALALVLHARIPQNTVGPAATEVLIVVAVEIDVDVAVSIEVDVAVVVSDAVSVTMLGGAVVMRHEQALLSRSGG